MHTDGGTEFGVQVPNTAVTLQQTWVRLTVRSSLSLSRRSAIQLTLSRKSVNRMLSPAAIS